jgi:hypothetical protein
VLTNGGDGEMWSDFEEDGGGRLTGGQWSFKHRFGGCLATTGGGRRAARHLGTHGGDVLDQLRP